MSILGEILLVVEQSEGFQISEKIGHEISIRCVKILGNFNAFFFFYIHKLVSGRH